MPRRDRISSLLLAASASLLTSSQSLIHDKCPLKVPSSIRTSPILIAHRGASYHLPEHTLQAYRLALELGADYIEPDLVATKDARLVALHTVDLSVTTDVADVFPNRQKLSPYQNKTGYWAHDFLLSELKQLRVKQRLPTARSTEYDSLFGIPTLEEILELLHDWNTVLLPQFHNLTQTDASARSSIVPRAGLYAELKDPEWIQTDSNQNLVDVFLDALSHSPHANHMWNDTACDALKFDQYLVPPLVVQCFTTSILEQVHNKWMHDYNHPLPPPLIKLLHASDCQNGNEEQMDQFWYHMGEARAFLGGLGVDKACLFPKFQAEEFQRQAYERDLVVHAWTVRPEETELMETGGGTASVQEELRYLFCDAKVDGVFSEDVTAARVAALVSCDEENMEESPSASPTAVDNQEECDNSETHTDGEILSYGFAAGVMGAFVGSILTFWLSNATLCRRRRGRRQLVIPQQEPNDLEMI